MNFAGVFSVRGCSWGSYGFSSVIGVSCWCLASGALNCEDWPWDWWLLGCVCVGGCLAMVMVVVSRINADELVVLAIVWFVSVLCRGR